VKKRKNKTTQNVKRNMKIECNEEEEMMATTKRIASGMWGGVNLMTLALNSFR
jgi:hypothetical protein